jgi:hypothetical protein
MKKLDISSRRNRQNSRHFDVFPANKTILLKKVRTRKTFFKTIVDKIVFTERRVTPCTSKLVFILAWQMLLAIFPPEATFKWGGGGYGLKFADGFPNGSFVIMTNSGLIDKYFFTTWLSNFQAHSVACPCLLLSDGHASHKDLKALEFCAGNNIHIVCLPSHTTQRLQRMERTFFKPLELYYDTECNSFMRKNFWGRVLWVWEWRKWHVLWILPYLILRPYCVIDCIDKGSSNFL